MANGQRGKGKQAQFKENTGQRAEGKGQRKMCNGPWTMGRAHYRAGTGRRAAVKCAIVQTMFSKKKDMFLGISSQKEIFI